MPQEAERCVVELATSAPRDGKIGTSTQEVNEVRRERHSEVMCAGTRGEAERWSPCVPLRCLPVVGVCVRRE